MLHSHARSGASGLGRRLGGPAATCGAISHTLTSCVRHPCSAAAAHLHRAACRAIRAAAGAAQAWVLQMACVRCAWRARGRRGRPAGALASVVQGGLHRASAPRGECAGLVSSALWDRLTATRRSVLLMVLRLGACGTTTGGGMTVASLEVACRWPVELVSSAVFYPKMSVILMTYDARVCLSLNISTIPTIHDLKGPLGCHECIGAGPAMPPPVGVNETVFYLV